MLGPVASIEFVQTARCDRVRDGHRQRDGKRGVGMRERVRARLLGIDAVRQCIGRFHVIREIGRGGSGRVLECLDEGLERALAVKVMNRPSDHAASLRREAMAIARVVHPRVVHVYEVGEHKGQLYIAMQLVRGMPLRQWQRQDHSWEHVVRTYVAAGGGLAAAHSAGVIHRDFKPDNVVVDGDGNPYVLDFGLAQPSPNLANNEAAITRSHRSRIPGTPQYMAPEQLEGNDADERSDQYAFAVSVFEAVYGSLPYDGHDAYRLARAFADGQLRPAPAKHPAPKSLRKALARALAFDPDKRWASLQALLDALDHIVIKARVATDTSIPHTNAELGRHRKSTTPAEVPEGVAALSPAVGARWRGLIALVISLLAIVTIVWWATSGTGAP